MGTNDDFNVFDVFLKHKITVKLLSSQPQLILGTHYLVVRELY